VLNTETSLQHALLPFDLQRYFLLPIIPPKKDSLKRPRKPKQACRGLALHWPTPIPSLSACASIRARAVPQLAEKTVAAKRPARISAAAQGGSIP
jgi:hypothetical protein